MKKRKRIFLVVLLIAMLGSLAWVVFHEREPEYQGKTLSEWLKGYNHWIGETGGPNKATDEAIRHMGTNAFPFLLRMIAAEDSKLKNFFVNLAGKQSLIKFHFTPASLVRVRAYCGLRALAKDAAPIIPRLIQSLNDVSVPALPIITETLAYIGPSGIQPLLDSLTNRNEEVRIYVVTALSFYRMGMDDTWPGTPVRSFSNAEMDSIDKRVLPVMMALLSDSSWSMRFQAIWSLGNIHQAPDLVIPKLGEILRNTNELNLIRSVTIEALGAFKDGAQIAVPILVKDLNNPDGDVRFAATNALKKINPEAAAKAGIK